MFQIRRVVTAGLILALVAAIVFLECFSQQKPKAATPVATTTNIQWSGDFDQGWKQFEQFTKEQKYEAASSLVEKMLESAKQSKNNSQWTRCLVRYTQLRMALHGYETSVRFLKEQPWPEDLISQSVLNLFYAQSLVTYAQSYSWEINKREKVDSKGAIDLKAWTKEQIYEEAQKAYENVWQQRQKLGDMPVTELQEYILPNNYPAGIRSTLRDAVSYLRVGLLADTNGWRPEQLNEIFELNLQKLIDGTIESKEQGKELSLTDPAVRPLEKICFILADLESWHSQKGERGGALEARFERLRNLHEHFTEAEDRAAIRQDLEKQLKALRDVPWWSQGMAQLAEFVQAEEAPDALSRAHEIARTGYAAYPDSVGGKHCQSIVKSIEHPEYSLAGMQADGPQKKSIVITHKNLEKIYFRAYSFDLENRLKTADDYNMYPQGNEVEKLIAGNQPVQQWEAALPATPDYKLHKTFITPPMTKPGVYLVVASGRPSFGKSNNQLIGLYLNITDLVLVTRQLGLDAEVTALSGSQGKPLRGVEVSLYKYDWQSHHSSAQSKLSDDKGMVQFHMTASNSRYFLFAKKGEQIAFDLDRLNFYQQVQPAEKTSALIFTDRSIYRPLQKVFWKVVVYKGRADEANFQTAPSSPATVLLVDGNQQIVESKTVTTNNFGTASGEFLIPAGRALGQWYIKSLDQGISIHVEEYKRPAYEAKLLDPAEPLRLNKPAHLKGEAKYYFGLPVTSGSVKWQVKREPVYPWWWSYCWWGGSSAGSSQSQIVARGSTSLKDDGTFNVDFIPKADDRLAKNKELTYRYSVTADVTDEGGETRSAQRSFRLGFVAVEASTDLGAGFFREGSAGEIKVRRNNLDGVPRAGKGSWRIVALKTPPRTLLPAEQPYFTTAEFEKQKGYETPGDAERERWNPGYRPESVMMQWESGPAKASGTLTHNAKGEGLVTMPKLAPGAYRFIYETSDDFGEKYETRTEFVMANNEQSLSLPALLLVENSSVQVGETARFLVHSGLKDQMMVFEVYRAGKCIRRQEFYSGKAPSVIEIPITEQDRGGLAVTMTLLRDYQFVHLRGSVIVPWDNKELNVAFSTLRDRLRPGQQERWSVKVTGPAGKDTAVSAVELLAYMYDRSLDSFASHMPANPMQLFPYRGNAILANASLGQARGTWIEYDGFSDWQDSWSLIGDSLDFYGGHGIGGPGRRSLSTLYGGVGGGQFRAPTAIPRAVGMVMDTVEVSAETPLLRTESAALQDSAKAKEVANAAINGRSAPAPPTSTPAVELRSDFSETAFWQPHLLTDKDGSVSFEFKVPDSVTSWNVWVHAITRDFMSGSVHKEARTVKDLMVRPYLPRFLREGDEAEIKVVVNNASDQELKGTLDFDIIDPSNEQSLLSQFGLSPAEAKGKPFTVAAGGGANLSFPIKTPAKVGQIAFKVTATSGDFSDGELRPIPILPGRMHLMQSRFVTLKDKSIRKMTFADLARNDDPTRINEQMVVTLDSQLFYSVLSALPYLVNYPYECTEQTLNRFVSTGILSSLYKDYPAIARMADEFSKRQTQYEQWDAADPNHKMALEETPWLQMAKGGSADPDQLINVLDSRITKAQRESSLAKLKSMQTSSGGFPWFPGGPPSPYMTLYTLYGFSKALEFGVDIPRDMVRPAWNYVHRHYLDELVKEMMEHDCCWEFVTFINYVLSNYPDSSWYSGSFTADERNKMLEFSFKHWRQHSPYLKGYLALTLKRMGRVKDAMLVWESVMDSAKTAEDQGTFWAPEDRGWLWYNDTIESHAFAIRTEMELLPADPKLDGMVLWIFLNKKLNHWKSTRATAEVIYSLAHYLKKTGQLGIREDATVTVGNQKTTFVFEPDQYAGKKNQIVVPGEKIDPQNTSTVTVEKDSKGYLFASATWQFSTAKLPTEERGDYLGVSRSYFKRINTGREFVLQPLAEGAALAVGDEVEVQLSITSKHPMEYVHLCDPRGAGFEPTSNISRYKWGLGIGWYEEIRDSGANFFFENLPQGEYTFKYRIRATTAGTFKVAPATLQPMYAPEFGAYSTGTELKIEN